jgi:PAS domain S-box-containing protein
MSEPLDSIDLCAADKTPGEDAGLWLTAIVDSSNDVIISKRLDGVITTWNAAAEKLFGYSEAEAVSQPITLIIPADLHDEEQDILRKLRAGERIERYETRRVTRDGRFLDVSITISPVRDAKGTIVGASKILQDITEAKRMREALRENERRLASELAGVRTLQSVSTRLISELTQGSLCEGILDAAMELMVADAASIQMLTPDGQSLKLLGWRNFHPESAVVWDQVTAEAGSTCGVALRDNNRVHVSDVESCVFMANTRDLEEYRRSGIRAVQSTPLQSRAGRPLGMLSTHWAAPHTPTVDDLTLFDVLARQAADLIERTRDDAALQRANERNTAFLRAVPDLMFVILRDGTYVDYSARDEKLLWAPPGAFLGRTVREIMPPALVATFMDAIERAFRHDDPVVVEYELQLGEMRCYFEGRIVQAGDDRVFAIVRDLTEAKRSAERNRDLAGRLIASQEAERRRIARELHDDLSQKTALLMMDIEGLANRCPQERARFQELRERVHEIAADLHNLSYELHPSKLEALGLLSALKALCRDVSQQGGVPIAFTHEAIPDGIDPSVSLCLYRITQEALHNVARHSHAPDAHVRLAGDARHLTLSIADSGVGFDARINPAGLGLLSMRERAALLRGEVVVDTAPGGGTRIGVRVPLRGNDQAQDFLNSH